MKIQVRYCVFGNFCSFKEYEVDTINKTQIFTKLFNELIKEEWAWPLTVNDVEITKIIEL